MFGIWCAEGKLIDVGDRLVVCVLFFFQAEDGIRDLYVTGVQTCALPILSLTGHDDVTITGAPGETVVLSLKNFVLQGSSSFTRSEERRVGKECRSRWSPYQ